AVEIHDRNAHTVLYFAFAEIVQAWLPARIMLKIFRDMLREQNMTGISAIHHALCDVYPRASDIGLLVKIRDGVHMSAVNPHSNTKLRMIFQFRRDFERAQHRRFGSRSKYKRTPVTCRQSQQFSFGFSRTELGGATYNPLQRLDLFA